MTETKHTPGPWTIIEHMSGWGETISKDPEDLMGILAANGSRVMWFGNSTNYYPTEGDAPNQYDASLIAAAPDLLEALAELLEANSYYFPTGNPWGDKARAAIDKATKS